MAIKIICAVRPTLDRVAEFSKATEGSNLINGENKEGGSEKND